MRCNSLVDISVVVGTRPEIVKMAPIISELRDRDVSFSLIHTGQHYDWEMSQAFLEELGLGIPDTHLDVGSGSHAEQTAEALVGLESTFLTHDPKVILVEGDTNTVVAAALAGSKLGIDVGHVEAGLRSYDLRMPEEHNRRIADHLSSFLFAPTSVAEENLRREAVWGQIFVTGNPVIDSCLRYLPMAEEKSTVLEELRFDEFCLATFHRAENVDDASTLREIVKMLTSCPTPVVYPIHPRTLARLKEAGLHESLAEDEHVQLLPPQGYFDFLVLMKHARLILTDSGGIQEEATAPNLRKKVFVVRRKTERPEAETAGYAELVGPKADVALPRIKSFLKEGQPLEAPSPYGDGTSGKRISGILQEILRGGHRPLAEGREGAEA